MYTQWKLLSILDKTLKFCVLCAFCSLAADIEYSSMSVQGYTSPSPMSLGSMMSIAESTCQTEVNAKNSPRDQNNSATAAATRLPGARATAASQAARAPDKWHYTDADRGHQAFGFTAR